jgi:phenylacetate-CoA ligase
MRSRSKRKPDRPSAASGLRQTQALTDHGREGGVRTGPSRVPWAIDSREAKAAVLGADLIGDKDGMGRRPTIDLDRAYARLPIALQELAHDLAGRRTQRVRYGRGFSELLAELEDRSFWTDDEIRRYRDARLQAFVGHAVETVPFYSRRFREVGLEPEDVRAVEDLAALPLLAKEDVQDANIDLVSTAFPRRRLITRRTSGTTGAGVRLLATVAADREQWAVWWRFLGWHGIQPGTLCAYFAGASTVPLAQTEPPFWRYNRAGRQIRFSRDHLHPGTASAYVGELRRRRPPWLHGHPSVLARLASYVMECPGGLGYEVRWVTVASEQLLSPQRAMIRDVFGVEPRQHYAMAEAVANASECERGRLHVDEDFAAVEFVRNGIPGRGRIAGTNLSNPAMPLIRYEVGDLATLDEAPCACGRPGRILGAIDGRTSEYVILSDGRRVTALSYIFKEMVHVREAQIHQREPGKITIRVVRGPGYEGGDESRLLESARRHLGDIVITIEYVDHLPRAPSGKLRLVDSELAGGDRRA